MVKTPLVLRDTDTVGRKMAALLKQSNSCQRVSLSSAAMLVAVQRVARWTKGMQKYLYGLKKNSNRKKKFKIVHP